MTTYTIEHYAADGHSGPEDNYVVATNVPSLPEARAIVRRRMGLGRLTAARRWGGMGNSVEAYHDQLASEANSDGCGGFAIVAEYADD